MTTHAETTLQKLQKAKEEKNKTQQAKDNTQERKDSLEITQNSLLGQLSSLNDDLEQIGISCRGWKKILRIKKHKSPGLRMSWQKLYVFRMSSMLP